MPRRLLVLSLLTLLLLAPASTAWARGDGWEPLANEPFTVEACGTTVDATFPMNKEYQQVTTDAEGNQHIKVTGALKVTLTDTATGRSVTYNISGPGTSIAYANGDFLFDATGRNLWFLTPEQAAATGLPQLFVTSGPISGRRIGGQHPATSRQEPIHNDSRRRGRRHDHSVAAGHTTALLAFTRQLSKAFM